MSIKKNSDYYKDIVVDNEQIRLLYKNETGENIPDFHFYENQEQMKFLNWLKQKAMPIIKIEDFKLKGMFYD